jgi:hypothetical protein
LFLLGVATYWQVSIVASPSRKSVTWPGWAAYFAGCAITFAVLRTMASHDVVNDKRYLTMYTLMAAAWIPICAQWMVLGIGFRDDVLERRNSAASIVLAGAILSAAFGFAAANIGDGPSWMVVAFCTVLANGLTALIWHLSNFCAPIAERITVDRDIATGVRAAAFLMGLGTVSGRAVAGNWVSVESTLADFGQRSLAVLPLLLPFVIFERKAQIRFDADQMLVTRAVVPGIYYVGAGILLAAGQGPLK